MRTICQVLIVDCGSVVSAIKESLNKNNITTYDHHWFVEFSLGGNIFKVLEERYGITVKHSYATEDSISGTVSIVHDSYHSHFSINSLAGLALKPDHVYYGTLVLINNIAHVYMREEQPC